MDRGIADSAPGSPAIDAPDRASRSADVERTAEVATFGLRRSPSLSVEKITRKRGAVWRVRWRDEAGRERSKVLGTKRDADAFDAEIRRRKRTGELRTLDAGKQMLSDFAEEWWHLHALPNLAPRTLEVYAGIWDRHVLPRLGSMPLRDLTPEIIVRFRAELAADRVGNASALKALALLQGVLQRAVEWQRISANPVRGIRKPPQARTLVLSPPSPRQVEQMRASLLARDRVRDAALVCVLAYAGLRPGEALALEWRHVGERAFLIDGSVSLGERKETKTRQKRSVRILGPLAEDVSRWRNVSAHGSSRDPVFPNAEGGLWSEHDYRNWRRRVYQPAAALVGVTGSRPYDLRHAFASLLIAEGRSIVDIAIQLGHSPTMTLSTYAHLVEELEGRRRRPAADVIRAARRSSG